MSQCHQECQDERDAISECRLPFRADLCGFILRNFSIDRRPDIPMATT